MSSACKVICMSVSLVRSPQEKDMFKSCFSSVEPPQGYEGELWPESQVHVWTREQEFKVGETYAMKTEVG